MVMQVQHSNNLGEVEGKILLVIVVEDALITGQAVVNHLTGFALTVEGTITLWKLVS